MRATFPYAVVQGAVLALYAVLPNYSSNFLYAYGFTDSQISLLLASAGSAVLGGVLLPLKARPGGTKKMLRGRDDFVIIEKISVQFVRQRAFCRR